MAKICNHTTCSYPVFGGGFCRAHQRFRTDKKPKPIKKISDKEVLRLKKYKKERIKYLAEHKICEVEGCEEEATEIHHKKGRVGDLLWNKKYFMAVNRSCHQKIENNPGWAYEKGYSVRRNQIEED